MVPHSGAMYINQRDGLQMVSSNTSKVLLFVLKYSNPKCT